MLEKLFNPESIAVIGASRTPGKVGHDILKNLLTGDFNGTVIPINPSADTILDLPCHTSLAE
ncbi:MAG: CoA-binding protein, partial [Thermodesulfobacteriota bacterium]|nr:CoA-binding protein [Thermodesulfobacteriota bacterium]